MNVPAIENASSDGPTIQFYGVEKVYAESGVDLTVLRDRLKLTVTQRWERNFQALRLVEAFREASRARRDGTAVVAGQRRG